MEQQSFYKRVIWPVIPVLGLVVISYLGYFGLRQVENDGLRPILAFGFGTIYFFSIVFGSLFVYTLGYTRGATLGERILASSVVPFIWMTKEVFRLTTSHPFVQCLYMYINPMHFWLILLVVVEMGTATMIGRKILKGRGRDIKILTPVPVISIIVALGLAVIMFSMGQGETVYVLFLEGFRLIFGSGLDT